MSSMSKVTVVTITYNAVQYLEKTLQSIISQDYKNIEYIIIDGGSIDGTLDIIKRYEEQIDLCLSEPDGGVYDAMNKGIDKASGHWINFMNAGDVFSSSTSVSDVIKVIDLESDVAIGGINTVNKDFKVVELKKFEGAENLWKFNPCYHQAAFVQTALMKKYKFDLRYEILSDYNFMLKAYISGCKFQSIDFPVANYLLGGLSEQNTTKVAIEGLSILSQYCENNENIYSSRWYGLLNNSNELNISTQLFQKYLDNIENIKKEYKKIALYGYGDAGKRAASILGDQVEVIIDKYSEEHPACKPENLKSFEYDVILITVIGREKEITKYLIDELSVDTNKIITFTS